MQRKFSILLAALTLLLAVFAGAAFAAEPASLTLAADPATVQPGGTSTLTAVVSDVYGQPVPGVQVDFSASAGTIDPATVVTGADGKAVTTLTAPGEVTVTAQVYGTALSASTTVTVQAPEQPEQPADAPKIVSTDPADGAVLDPVGRYSLSVMFDRPVTIADPAGFTLVEAATMASVEVTPWADGQQVTLGIGQLKLETDYVLTVKANAVADAVNLAVTGPAQDLTVKFRTVPELKVVEITPAPGSTVDARQPVRIRFDRPVSFEETGCVVKTGDKFAPGCYSWKLDPTDPAAVVLAFSGDNFALPAGDVTVQGIARAWVKGRDDGARLAQDVPDLAYTVQAKSPEIIEGSPQDGFLLGLGTVFGHISVANIAPSFPLYAAFDVPVEIVDPAKIKLVVETPTGTLEKVAGVDWPVAVTVEGNRVTVDANYLVVSVLGPAMKGQVSLVFGPGSVRHFGASSDGDMTTTGAYVFSVNTTSEQGDVVPGKSVEAPLLRPFQQGVKTEWKVPLPGSRLIGYVRGSGGMFYVVDNRGLSLIRDGELIQTVEGDFSAPVVDPADGTVYVARKHSGVGPFSPTNGAGQLEAYNWDGSVRWKVTIPGDATLSMAGHDVVAVVWGEEAGGIFGPAYQPVVLHRYGPDGRLKAAVDLSSLEGRANWKLAVHGGRVVLLNDCSLVVLRLPESGEPRLEDILETKVDLLADIQTAGDPVTGGLFPYAVAADDEGFYAAVDRVFGDYDLGTGSESRAVRVYWLSPAGEPKLKVDLDRCYPASFVVLAPDKIYFGNYAVDRATGQAMDIYPDSDGGYRNRVLGIAENGDVLVAWSGLPLPGPKPQFRLFFLSPDGSTREVASSISVLGGRLNYHGDLYSWRVNPVAPGSLYLFVENPDDPDLSPWVYGLVKLSDAQQPPAPVPVRLEVRPAEATVKVGESQQYRAYVIYSDGSERDVTGEAAWSVSDPSIASVAQGQQGGLATGLKPGRVDVVAAWEVK